MRASCRSRAADPAQAEVCGTPNTVCGNCWILCVPAGAGVEQLLLQVGGWTWWLVCIGWRENIKLECLPRRYREARPVAMIVEITDRRAVV